LNALADALAEVIASRGPLPAGELATAVRKRKADVLETLRADARFVQHGRRRASRFDLAGTVRSFDASEAAERWNCDISTAERIIFGREGFLKLGLVRSLNGNGRVVVTELGLKLARVLEQAR
jgi:hypothetical protein